MDLGRYGLQGDVSDQYTRLSQRKDDSDKPQRKTGGLRLFTGLVVLGSTPKCPLGQPTAKTGPRRHADVTDRTPGLSRDTRDRWKEEYYGECEWGDPPATEEGRRRETRTGVVVYVSKRIVVQAPVSGT